MFTSTSLRSVFLPAVLCIAAGVTAAQAPSFAALRRTIPEDDDDTNAVVLGDLDGDGDLDLLVGNDGPCRYYRNGGGGRFEDLSATLPASVAWIGDLALGDVDGDGDLDVLACTSFGSLRSFVNDGAGGLSDAPAGALPVVNGVGTVALGDLDADGDVDAVVAGFGPTLLTNDGTGNFTSIALPLTSGGYVRDVVFVDANGDGALDVFLAREGTNDLFLGDGSGGFSVDPARLPNDSHRTAEAAFADFDCDGDLDLFCANGQLYNFGDPNALYVNDGTGTFARANRLLPQRTTRTRSVAAADVDGDGDVDLLLGNASTYDELYLNDGTGRFVDAAQGLPALPDFTDAVVFGDVDADGDVDAVVGRRTALFSSPQTQLLLNVGAGTFVDVTSTMPSRDPRTADVGLADVDGDGDLDAVVAGLVGVWLLENDGTGVLTDRSSALPGYASAGGYDQAVVLADMDGDGDPDLLLGSPSYLGNAVVTYYGNDGPAGFVDRSSMFADPLSNMGYGGGGHVSDVAVGDIDGDQDLDVVLARLGYNGYGASGEGAANSLYRNDGAAGFVEASDGLPAHVEPNVCVEMLDVDGDADQDLVFGGSLNRLYLNDGQGHFEDASANLQSTGWTSDFVSGDFDGDGDLDLVSVGTVNSMGVLQGALLLSNDGAGTFVVTGGVEAGPGEYFFAGAAADLDGDGDLDAVLTTSLDEVVALNDGRGGLTRAGTLPDSTFSSTSEDVALGDLDGDGDVDVFVTHGDRDDEIAFHLGRQLSRGAPARVGQELELRLDGTPRARWLLASSLAAAERRLPGLGTLRLDPRTHAVAGTGILDGSGRAKVRFLVPNDAAIAGTTLHWQALIGRPMRFSNREATTILP